MEDHTKRSRIWRGLPFLLILLVMLVTGGIALAGVPASLPSDTKASPPAQGATNGKQVKPTTSGQTSKAKQAPLSQPAAPNVILYDQYGAPATDDTSQDFEASFDAYDNTAADDFVVPSGQTWTINEVDAGGDVSIARPASPLFNVYIYQNNGGLPGTQVYSAMSQTTGGSGAEYDVTLSSPAVLSAGSYWVSVQARWDFNTDGQWYWQNQATPHGTAAAWQNPGDGFGSGCTSWADMQTCLGQSGNPDQVYRLAGTVQAGTATPTVTGTPPTATNTPVATATACVTNYTIATGTGTIVPGTTDTGNHCDDCLTSITLPFAYSLYGQTFTSASVDSNGTLQFVANVSTFSNTCLPATGDTYTILPMWDDMYTINSGYGIFTSVSGTAPNRIFNIEWRAQYFPGSGNVNFEVRLYEGQSRFDVVYGAIDDQGASATVGVQKNGSNITQFECNTGGLTNGLLLTFTQNDCASPTPGTPQPTNTPAATATCQAGGTPGPWTAAAPYPITIVRYGFAQVGDSFYVIGGVSDGTRVANVNRYDVGSNTWTSLASIPVASEAPTCAYNSSTNKIYCAEGDTGNSFQIYDIASNTWTAGPAVPGATDRYGASSGSFGNFVYIVGGSTSIQSDVQVYNISANSWSAGTPAANALLLAGYHEEGQYLYVVGGFSSGGPNGPNAAASSVIGKSKSHPAHPALGSNPSKSLPGAPDANNATTLRLDMSSGTWSSGPAWTMSRADMGVAYSGGKLYAMGGDTTGGGFFDSSNEVDELDVSAWPSGSWTTSPPVLPAPNRQANQAGFTSADGRIWSVGGIDGSTFQFLPDNYYRSNGGGCGGGGTATPTPQATPTQCTSNGVQQVLYDQYGTPATDDTSQDFETAFDAYDNTAADDFVVPSGQTWTINEVDAGGDVSIARPASPLFNVYIYQNNGGQPGTQVYSALSQTTGGSGSDYNVTLSSPAVLSAGSYWVSVQARWDFNTDGQWYWQNQAAQAGNATQWQNPGDGFGSGCTSWADMQTCLGQSGNPDQVYRLIGSSGGGGGCATATPGTPQPTATQGQPTATPTCQASAGGWSGGPDLPTPLVRAVGVYFPSDGMFYTVGGRVSDAAGSDFQHVLQFNPSSNSWTQMGVTLPDTSMNNMACGVLTVGGTPSIYCVGGSTAGQTTATARVFSYNPATDTATTLNSADDWPGDASGTILPGGFAVSGNKLYILGGFDINVASTNQIWEFDPTAAQGSKWVQKVNTPEGIMYAPTTAIGGIIYVGGASDYQGGTVVDTTNSFSFDPATNTIGTIALIPRAAGETRGLVVGGQMWVLGGGRVAPNPSNEVDIYDPGTDSWSLGTPFSNARRNFPTDSDGTRVWLGGGYDVDGVTPLQSMEIFSPGTGCPTATATSPAATATSPAATATSPAATATSPAATATSPAATATSPAATVTAPPATATSPAATATPTACTLQFRDVRQGSTFYQFIHCLVCLGIVSGYPDGTFRPNANLTRGQLSKIVSNSAGFSDTATGQQFQDVAPGSTFYDYIYRLSTRGYISGYPCGGALEPCVPPDNLPYFRPNQPASRGQIAKIVSNAAGFTDTPSGQQFQDVPPSGPGSTFYTFIYRLVHRGIINGYACGSVPQEPCVPPANLPYFRPNNNTTRGQMSKIDDLGFFPNCSIPARPAQLNQ